MEVVSIFLNRILLAGQKKRATSLHLSSDSLPIVRVNNQLLEVAGEPVVEHDLLMGIIKSILMEDELNVLGEKKEITIAKDLAGDLRFRINIFKQNNSYSISFYYVSKKIKTIKELELPEVLSGIVKQKTGLLVVAGPQGSGRTATSSALVEEVNSVGGHIVTIEEPIDNIFVRNKALIDQRQVGRDVKTADDAIKYCLMDDVDFVYIGEIRKHFELAFPLAAELASGNAFVLLELNATSSVQVIEKLTTALESKYNEEAARFMLADVLSAIITQKSFFKKPTGKVIARELMINNAAIQSLIREGKHFQIESVIQTSRNEGMISMAKSIEDLVSRGVINENDVY
ncbi:hypothetical protein C0584_01535 [Candidatus Parcubacteria bacterium]|nr:MAG: hypothetical protein C0584_01535 [Candidatus Parcubacteria bacterium]